MPPFLRYAERTSIVESTRKALKMSVMTVIETSTSAMSEVVQGL